MFAILAMEHPSVILLDEPTNHLDMVSLRALPVVVRGLIIRRARSMLWLLLSRSSREVSLLSRTISVSCLPQLGRVMRFPDELSADIP